MSPYAPARGRFYYGRKGGFPPGTLYVRRVVDGRPTDWLGTITRTDAGWTACTSPDRPRLGPVPSRQAAAEALVADRARIAAENRAARPDIYRS